MIYEMDGALIKERLRCKPKPFYLFIYLFQDLYIQVLEQKDIASPTRFNQLPNPINLETV